MATPPPLLVRGARVLDPTAGIDGLHDVLVTLDEVRLDPTRCPEHMTILDAAGLLVLPGLIDLQVHFRQPGFEYKETIETGSAAALAGGITTVVVMPNTRPSLDTPESVRFEWEESRRVRGVDLLVAGAATRGLGGKELTDHGALKAAGAVAITDDGLPVMDDEVMAGSLRLCREHDLLFMQHAEDLDLTQHAPMTEGPTSHAIGVRGQPADAEGVMVERDLALVGQIGARYHVLHTSTARSLRAIKSAKAAGLPVSCEASPHHLLLTDEACASADPNTKMNPPLRCEADRRALVEAVAEGTVDAIATDHAPHSADEKAAGFEKAPFGVIGLETAFAAALELVHRGVIDLPRAVELMTSGPARVLRRSGSLGTLLGPHAPRHLTLVDPGLAWTVTADTLFGRSKNSAFLGREFRGKVLATVLHGELRHVDASYAGRIG
jgi:dihydroorotase